MAAPTQNCFKKFLLHFVNEHVEFRLPELHSLASIVGSKVTIDENSDTLENPFVVVELASEAVATSIAQKSVLIRCLYELWGSAKCHTDLYQQLLQLPKSLLEKHTQREKTFRIRVETFNHSLSSAEKIKRIEGIPLNELGFTGRIDLTDPHTSLHMFEYYSKKGHGVPKTPECIYFGRWLAEGQRAKIKEYNLKQRHFIGHTSMDTCLSLLMANIAQIRPNSLVYDPFVGTGSLCVACAHSGAYVMGADIDYLIIHGKGRSSRHNQLMRGPDENIRANLRQYGLEHLYLDVLVGDSSLHKLLRHNTLFDAIVTDPPYGIREAAKKIGSEKQDPVEGSGDRFHVPKCVNYQLSDIFVDLLNFAARFLKLHGHLVYWLPVYRSQYTPANVPTHPCLKLMSNSEQALSAKVGRRLISMQKTRNFSVEETEGGASISEDHYSDVSFRDRYFKIADTPRETGNATDGVSDARSNKQANSTYS